MNERYEASVTIGPDEIVFALTDGRKIHLSLTKDVLDKSDVATAVAWANAVALQSLHQRQAEMTRALGALTEALRDLVARAKPADPEAAMRTAMTMAKEMMDQTGPPTIVNQDD